MIATSEARGHYFGIKPDIQYVSYAFGSVGNGASRNNIVEQRQDQTGTQHRFIACTIIWFHENKHTTSKSSVICNYSPTLLCTARVKKAKKQTATTSCLFVSPAFSENLIELKNPTQSLCEYVKAAFIKLMGFDFFGFLSSCQDINWIGYVS